LRRCSSTQGPQWRGLTGCGSSHRHRACVLRRCSSMQGPRRRGSAGYGDASALLHLVASMSPQPACVCRPDPVKSVGAVVDWRSCCGAGTLGAGTGCGPADLGARGATAHPCSGGPLGTTRSRVRESQLPGAGCAKESACHWNAQPPSPLLI
jgi:hypothetical protein